MQPVDPPEFHTPCPARPKAARRPVIGLFEFGASAVRIGSLGGPRPPVIAAARTTARSARDVSRPADRPALPPYAA